MFRLRRGVPRLTGVVPVTLLLGAAGGDGGVLVVAACPAALTATWVPALLHTARIGYHHHLLHPYRQKALGLVGACCGGPLWG